LLTLFPYTTLFRSYIRLLSFYTPHDLFMQHKLLNQYTIRFHNFHMFHLQVKPLRSEEHTSELQSRFDLVCRLLLEKKNKKNDYNVNDCTDYQVWMIVA